MDNIKILSLKDCQQYVDTVTRWLHDEWGHNNYDYWKSWVVSSLYGQPIPQTFILTVNGEPAGTYSLWRCDLQSRQDLCPWFGGLYVDKKFRGKVYNGTKLGVIMQKHALELLIQADECDKVFLFTEKSPEYYVENGWCVMGTAINDDNSVVTLCYYNLR